MKVLVAGVGSIGSRHVGNLLSLGITDLVLYRTGKGALPLDDRFASLPVYHDFDEALKQRPEAVFITNPTALHIPLALQAAQRGCHLFIEKPLSHTLENIEALRAEVTRQGLICFLACQFRFHPHLQMLKQWLTEGRLGRIFYARVEYGEYLPDWHPGEDCRQGYSARADLGGGAILTVIHPLDYLYWMFGEVETVSAVTSRVSDLVVDVEDVADILLRFTRGPHAHVHLDYLQRPRIHTLTVIGDKGKAYWDLHGKILTLNQGDGTQLYRDEAFDRNQMYLAETRHFFDCLHGKVQPLIPLDEGIAVLKIALKALASAHANGHP